MLTIACIVSTASFASTVTLLEAKRRDENRHEGGDGRGQRNDIVGLGIASAQRAIERIAHRALEVTGNHGG